MWYSCYDPNDVDNPFAVLKLDGIPVGVASAKMQYFGANSRCLKIGDADE